RSAAITIPVGKSDNVHSESAFSDVVVADPETADVVPLTDHSVSILGKKIGATRVSLYGEGKRLVGLLDPKGARATGGRNGEVAGQWRRGKIRVRSLNGGLMRSGSAPDGITVDKAMIFAKQFGPDVVNSIQVCEPQQVLLAVRFIEVSRTASRELGISWSVVNQNVSAVIGTGTLVTGNAPFGTVLAHV